MSIAKLTFTTKVLSVLVSNPRLHCRVCHRTLPCCTIFAEQHRYKAATVKKAAAEAAERGDLQEADARKAVEVVGFGILGLLRCSVIVLGLNDCAFNALP